MENVNTGTDVVAAPSTFSTIINHPATRITATVASYLGTAVAGWYFGKKVEKAYAKRQATAEKTEVHAEQVRTQHTEHRAQA